MFPPYEWEVRVSTTSKVLNPMLSFGVIPHSLHGRIRPLPVINGKQIQKTLLLV